MTEYIVEVDDKVAEVFVERFDWETVTLFGHHLVGEIVRCRDCKNFVIVDEIHGDYDDYPIYGCCLLKLSNARIDDEVQEPQDPDGFCAWGERK